MLPKRHRFSFKKGAPRRVFSTPLFAIRYDFTESEGIHAGVVVGKKVDKRAVGRNKIKRSIQEIIKRLIPFETNIALVVFAKKACKDADKQVLEEQLQKAFEIINKRQ